MNSAEAEVLVVTHLAVFSNTLNYLRDLLAPAPELLPQYDSEGEPDNREVLVKYLRLLNERG